MEMRQGGSHFIYRDKSLCTWCPSEQKKSVLRSRRTQTHNKQRKKSTHERIKSLDWPSGQMETRRAARASRLQAWRSQLYVLANVSECGVQIHIGSKRRRTHRVYTPKLCNKKCREQQGKRVRSWRARPTFCFRGAHTI
jgi:hypothetical protein